MATAAVPWDTAVKEEISQGIRTVGKCLQLIAARPNPGNRQIAAENNPRRDIRVVGVGVSVWGVLTDFQYRLRNQGDFTKTLYCTCVLDPAGVSSVSIGDFIVDNQEKYVVEDYTKEQPGKEVLVYMLGLRRG